MRRESISAGDRAECESDLREDRNVRVDLQNAAPAFTTAGGAEPTAASLGYGSMLARERGCGTRNFLAHDIGHLGADPDDPDTVVVQAEDATPHTPRIPACRTRTACVLVALARSLPPP
jgi:hypothetical protein